MPDPETFDGWMMELRQGGRWKPHAIGLTMKPIQNRANVANRYGSEARVVQITITRKENGNG